MFGNERTTLVNETPRAEGIAQLNDRLRQTFGGGHIMVTRGVSSLPEFDAAALIAGLALYDAFDADNDPHGERDFGDLTLFGETLLWKIDYYDRKMEFVSPDAADSAQTIRVLTVMLESEY